MPFTQKLLFSTPVAILGPLIVGTSVIVAIVIIFIIHYLIPHYKPEKSNQTIVALFTGTKLIYAVLIIVILFISWSGLKQTNDDIEREANGLLELYRSTESFLPEIKEPIRDLLQEYIKSIVNDEWNTLQRSELNPQTTVIAGKIWSIYSHYSPKTVTEQIFLQESIRKLYEMRENRTERLSDSETGIFSLLWIVLIAGEIVVITSIPFFVEGLIARTIMAVSFAFLVGLIYFTILLFDYPFTGDSIVSSKPLTRIMSYW